MTTSADEFLKILPDAAAVAYLASVRASETLHFDAKRCSEPLSADDKKKLAKAISGFANSDGGVLIYGLVAAGGDKAKGIPDVVTRVEPVKNLNNLESELNSQVGQSTEPPVQNVKVLRRESAKQPNTGFILVHIPASDGPPHRSVPDREYYRRHGSGFYPMEHFEIAEMFGSRQRPRLELYWTLRVIHYQGTRPTRTCRLNFIVGLQNIGRGIARFPALVLSRVRLAQGGLDGSGRLGLQQRPTSDFSKLILGGGADDVIYPDSTLEVAPLDPVLEVYEVVPDFSRYSRVLQYELYAGGMMPVRDEVTIDPAMLEKRFLQIHVK
jgi:hypothetical protein